MDFSDVPALVDDEIINLIGSRTVFLLDPREIAAQNCDLPFQDESFQSPHRVRKEL